MIVSRILESHPLEIHINATGTPRLRNQGCIISYSDFHCPLCTRGNQAPGTSSWCFPPWVYWLFLCWIPGEFHTLYSRSLILPLSVISLSFHHTPSCLPPLFTLLLIRYISPIFSLAIYDSGIYSSFIPHPHLIAILTSILFFTYWE